MENGKVEIALSKFRKPYNCAQTVYAAFKGGDAEGLEELSKCGGGKAPRGFVARSTRRSNCAPGRRIKSARNFQRRQARNFAAR